MAFTTKDFPNKVFETISEYEHYIEFRKQVRARLASRVRSKPARVVKVAGALRKGDPIYETMYTWISQLART